MGSFKTFGRYVYAFFVGFPQYLYPLQSVFGAISDVTYACHRSSGLDLYANDNAGMDRWVSVVGQINKKWKPRLPKI